MVYGTPSALPLLPSKLERMSLRTTPLSLSTSGPFEPSPGNGPPVSSGITEHDPTAVEAPVVVVAPVRVVVPPVVDGLTPVESPPPEQPATARPSPPSSANAPRRGPRRGGGLEPNAGPAA